jgi:hypothetical protein
MEYAGLILEFIFLGIGIYFYLFSIGKIKSKDPKAQQKAESFRKSNHRWLRLLSLALMALMSLNIIVHIQSLIS